MNRAGTSSAVAALTYAMADFLARFSKPQTGPEEEQSAPSPATLAQDDHPRPAARLVTQELTTKIAEAAALSAAYVVHGQKDPDVLNRTAECFEYVISRVRGGADVGTRAALDWDDTPQSDAQMLSLIESGGMNLGSAAFKVFQERIAGSGTTAQRRRFAAALRRGVAGIKMGRRPNKRPANLDTLRKMLPELDKAVKAARDRSNLDDTALTQFLKRAAPGIDVRQLRQRVRRAGRRGLAIELVAAAVLGVTRDVARDAIRLVGRENGTKSRPHNS